MSNIEQGISKEEVGGRLYAKLLLAAFGCLALAGGAPVEGWPEDGTQGGLP